MNLFDEFFGVVRGLQEAAIRHSVVGGIAMAFHDEPRFTRDIDILVHPDDVAKVSAAMGKLGYFEASKPWTFANTQLTLHRFMKAEGEDHLIVDILSSAQDRYRKIVDAAAEHPWAEGVVRVVRKEDLIWLKQQRGSDQDKVDIRKLQDDKDRENSPAGK